MTTVVHDPGNYLEKITEVYVFASMDEGGEGVVGHSVFDARMDCHVFMPFVCADKARMESLKPLAKKIAKETGKRIRLIKLTHRVELEEY